MSCQDSSDDSISNGAYKELDDTDDSQSNTGDSSNECDNTEYDYCEVADVCLSFENLNESEQFFEIRITSNKYAKGFQFNFDSEDITIIGFSGGITQESGLSPSNSDNTILAFSFSANFIPAVDDGLLGNLYYSNHMLDDMSILVATFSDCFGNPLNVDYSISF